MRKRDRFKDKTFRSGPLSLRVMDFDGYDGYQVHILDEARKTERMLILDDMQVEAELTKLGLV